MKQQKARKQEREEKECVDEGEQASEEEKPAHRFCTGREYV